jgi:RNA polymerase sigma-70 factor (ECF subfamily)
MARDAQRFEALLAEHERLVLKVASAYARTADERRDLAQEIATQLWRAFDRYDERLGKFSTWLYRIALNVAISQLRRARRLEPLEPHLETLEAPGAAGAPDERVRALYRAIGELDPLNRALLLLYLEDRPYAEIAEILGITESNVATKINRLKHALRARLAHAEGA